MRLSLFTLGINNEKVLKNPSHESTFSCRHWYAHFHTLMVIGMEIVVEGFSITNIAHHILSYEGLHNVKRTTQKSFNFLSNLQNISIFFLSYQIPISCLKKQTSIYNLSIIDKVIFLAQTCIQQVYLLRYLCSVIFKNYSIDYCFWKLYYFLRNEKPYIFT